MIRLLHILVIVNLPVSVTGKAEQQLVGYFQALSQYLSITILGIMMFLFISNTNYYHFKAMCREYKRDVLSYNTLQVNFTLKIRT